MLYYPVSDKFALLVGGENNLEIEVITENDRVNMLNYKMVEAHNDFLFSSSEKQLKDLVTQSNIYNNIITREIRQDNRYP